MRRAILLFLLCAVPSAFGQSNYAAVTGAVTDPQHSPIAGAAVVLTAKETHAGRRVSTNTQGIAMAPWTLAPLERWAPRSLSLKTTLGARSVNLTERSLKRFPQQFLFL